MVKRRTGWQFAVTPKHRLAIIEIAADSANERGVVHDETLVPDDVVDSFLHSVPAGLTSLAKEKDWKSLSLVAQFWHAYAARYFKALSRLPISSSERWQGPDCPRIDAIMELLESAPPMHGWEYADAQTLQTLWDALNEFTHEQVTQAGKSVAEYLKSLRSDWNLVGRVTFHLAENKKNEDRPFAFLATYTDGQSATGAVQHVPLSEALRQSIASKDTMQLNMLLEPVSRAAQSTKLIASLLESRGLFAPQAWGIKQAFDFLSHVPQMEDAGVIVRVPNWWNSSKPPRPQVQVNIGSKSQSTIGGANNLDLEVGVVIDGDPLSDDELKSLMAAREGMTLLRGKWVQVDHDQLQAALSQWKQLQKSRVSGVDFLEGLRMLSGVSLGSDSVAEDIRGGVRVQAGPWLSEMLSNLRDPSGMIPIDPNQYVQATLRPYQMEGVRWLWFATQLGLGVCLADDMGLGKTLQTIALLLQLKHDRLGGRKNGSSKSPAENAPSLLILPTSLLGNWQREVQRFGPELRMFVAHRSMCDPAVLAKVVANPAKALAGYDLVATTYGLARREKWLTEMKWNLVILDEAQAIKNASSAQSRAIKAIPNQGRITLTGTPVENHLGDLWSLFDFCSPGLLGTAAEFKKFAKTTDAETAAKRMTSLRRLIRPYILRRMKTDPKIVPDLPDKTEMRVDCGLTPTQAALYRQVVDELQQAIDIATGIQRRGMVLAALMQLKQICNHPALYLKQAKFKADASGKFAELQSICQTVIEKQEKVIVFSQFQSMCDPLAEFLCGVFGHAGLVLTGKTPAKSRAKLVSEFQQDNGPPFMIVSVKAGGTGLNLTQASHVVHFDRWWNPAVEDQATDRAFRIGQKRNVLVHKFVCRGTLEEKIDDLIQSKKAISRELFAGDGELQLTELSNEQLLNFVALDLNKSGLN